MALGTITKVSDYTDANKRVRVRDVVPTSGANYTTGGETITPAMVGLSRRIEQAIVHGPAIPLAGTSAFVATFNNVTQKLQLFTSNGAAPAQLLEAPASTNASTFGCRITFVGI